MPAVILPERCDRAAAEALLPDFIEAMGVGAAEVDARAVRQVSHAMLQLLASARKARPELRIAPSDALREAAAITGLTSHLFDGVEP